MAKESKQELRITIKPVSQEDNIDHMEITYDFSSVSLEAGDEITSMDICTVSIPGAEPEEVAFRINGRVLPFRSEDNNPYPYVRRSYIAEADAKGALGITYLVRPRALTGKDVCGPYFDFRLEEGGANTAGISILMNRPSFEGSIALEWDLSCMPAGTEAVCTWGEGNLNRKGNIDLFRHIYYAIGQIHKVTDGEFGFYWLSRPDFDIQEIADYTRKLFAVMQGFFRDEDPVYRIFIRKDPFPSSGGTALLRSYMLGWTPFQTVSVKEKQNILAHEMVHNWPQIPDEPYGLATWYVEGTAEYYSIMIPLRAGLIDKETALFEIQKRTESYYTNPTRHMENIEAANICWQDRRAQRLAYGRGIFFLANTDAKMKAATQGRYGIDDVVLGILEKERQGNEVSIDTFFELGGTFSGIDIRSDYESMRTGEHFAPLPDSFDACFQVEEVEAAEADTGKPAVSYRWSIRK